MEYRSVIWDPYTKHDIAKLENIQRSAARIVMKNYHSSQEGSVTEMLNYIKASNTSGSSLRPEADIDVQGGRRAWTGDCIQQQRQRRAILATQYTDHEDQNIVENYSTNISKCYKPIPAKTPFLC